MKYVVPLLVLLMGADLVLTFIGLEMGAHEANPLFPKSLMGIAKISATIITVALCYFTRKWRPMKWYIRGATLVMGGVVVNNIIVLCLLV